MKRGLITTVVGLAMLVSSAASAQPYQHGRGGPGNQPQAAEGCYRGESSGDCRERVRVQQRTNRQYVYRDGRYEAHDDTGAAVAVGILGFMLGAAIAGSSHDRDYYNAHRNDHGWRDRCTRSYRSFDYGTGTYVGRDGYRHYCTR